MTRNDWIASGVLAATAGALLWPRKKQAWSPSRDRTPEPDVFSYARKHRVSPERAAAIIHEKRRAGHYIR
jgi:hypothetical protein